MRSFFFYVFKLFSRLGENLSCSNANFFPISVMKLPRSQPPVFYYSILLGATVSRFEHSEAMVLIIKSSTWTWEKSSTEFRHGIVANDDKIFR